MERVLRSEELTFVVSLVLVPAGQSGQEYRACMNLPEVNARTKDSPYPLPDC